MRPSAQVSGLEAGGVEVDLNRAQDTENPAETTSNADRQAEPVRFAAGTYVSPYTAAVIQLSPSNVCSSNTTILIQHHRVAAMTVSSLTEGVKPTETRHSHARSEAKALENTTLAHHLMPGAFDEHWMVTTIKNVVSGALLLFCLTLLSAAVFCHQTRATGEPYRLNSVVAYCLLWVVLIWLAVIEGGLNCMVGLRPINRELYKDSHPLTYKATQLTLADTSKNHLERFIVGRQYMDLTMVFTISFLASAVKGASVLGLPDQVCRIFLSAGLAMTLVTIVLGQLALQVNAATCKLDFVNNYVMLFSTYVAIGVEASGVCHFVYLVQRIATRNKVKDAGSQQITSRLQRFAFWGRVLISTTLLLFSLVTVIAATFSKDTRMFEGVPGWATMIIFVSLILLVGFLDALQIALMAVVHIPQEELQHCPRALRNCEYVRGKKLQSFLLGRQIGQTVIQFMLARITTLNIPLGEGRNMWGVSDSVQKLFNGGALGAIIATVLASLIWRVLASEFPLVFLASPFTKPLINSCYLLERSGIINVSWLLARLHRKCMGLRPDECYLGLPQPKIGVSCHDGSTDSSQADSQASTENSRDEESAL
jgi:hypothetical protein